MKIPIINEIELILKRALLNFFISNFYGQLKTFQFIFKEGYSINVPTTKSTKLGPTATNAAG